jgi:DNA-binding winged helix-turn-helix (wHTH) protein
MEAVWGYRNDTASNVVDVVVRSLRRKLGAEASAVETVRGTGYRISDASLDAMTGALRCQNCCCDDAIRTVYFR